MFLWLVRTTLMNLNPLLTSRLKCSVEYKASYVYHPVCIVLLGYGWAGILRRYLVDPVDMWWPSNFAQVSLFRAMIQGEASIKKVVVVCGESGSHEPSYEKNKNLHEDGGDGERPSPEGEEGVEEDEEHA
nr:uncharacterized protein LOC112722531 isoform X1 [Arachis hypogaea]